MNSTTSMDIKPKEDTQSIPIHKDSEKTKDQSEDVKYVVHLITRDSSTSSETNQDSLGKTNHSRVIHKSCFQTRNRKPSILKTRDIQFKDFNIVEFNQNEPSNVFIPITDLIKNDLNTSLTTEKEEKEENDITRRNSNILEDWEEDDEPYIDIRKTQQEIKFLQRFNKLNDQSFKLKEQLLRNSLTSREIHNNLSQLSAVSKNDYKKGRGSLDSNLIKSSFSENMSSNSSTNSSSINDSKLKSIGLTVPNRGRQSMNFGTGLQDSMNESRDSLDAYDDDSVNYDRFSSRPSMYAKQEEKDAFQTAEEEWRNNRNYNDDDMNDAYDIYKDTRGSLGGMNMIEFKQKEMEYTQPSLSSKPFLGRQSFGANLMNADNSVSLTEEDIPSNERLSPSTNIEQESISNYVYDDNNENNSQEYKEEPPIEEQPMDEQPMDEQLIDEQPIEEQPIYEQPMDEQLIEEQPIYEQLIEEEQTQEQNLFFDENGNYCVEDETGKHVYTDMHYDEVDNDLLKQPEESNTDLKTTTNYEQKQNLIITDETIQESDILNSYRASLSRRETLRIVAKSLKESENNKFVLSEDDSELLCSFMQDLNELMNANQNLCITYDDFCTYCDDLSDHGFFLLTKVDQFRVYIVNHMIEMYNQSNHRDLTELTTMDQNTTTYCGIVTDIVKLLLSIYTDPTCDKPKDMDVMTYMLTSTFNNEYIMNLLNGGVGDICYQEPRSSILPKDNVEYTKEIQDKRRSIAGIVINNLDESLSFIHNDTTTNTSPNVTTSTVDTTSTSGPLFSPIATSQKNNTKMNFNFDKNPTEDSVCQASITMDESSLGCSYINSYGKQSMLTGRQSAFNFNNSSQSPITDSNDSLADSLLDTSSTNTEFESKAKGRMSGLLNNNEVDESITNNEPFDEEAFQTKRNAMYERLCSFQLENEVTIYTVSAINQFYKKIKDFVELKDVVSIYTCMTTTASVFQDTVQNLKDTTQTLEEEKIHLTKALDTYKMPTYVDSIELDNQYESVKNRLQYIDHLYDLSISWSFGTILTYSYSHMDQSTTTFTITFPSAYSLNAPILMFKVHSGSMIPKLKSRLDALKCSTDLDIRTNREEVFKQFRQILFIFETCKKMDM